MANLFKLLNKTKTIEERMESIFAEIKSDYSKNKIKTETEFMYRLCIALKAFFSSIGKPTFKYRPANSLPYSEDYNNMVKEAVADVTAMVNECKNLNQVLDQSFSEVELDRKMLGSRVKFMSKKIEYITNKVNNNKSFTIFSDSFVNTNNLDRPMCKGKIANINTSEGILSLAMITDTNYSSDCIVEILDGSNGFPGNSHIVDTQDNALHFIGEDNLHKTLSELIDDNRDTWFEYELFNVDDYTIDNCNDLGFEYVEGLRWATEDEKLILNLRFTMKNPDITNWLSLSPYIPEHKGSRPGVITNITISDGKGSVQSLINSSKTFDDDAIFIFKPQVVKYVTIQMEQAFSYGIDVGHYYFVETAPGNALIFDDVANTYNTRVDGIKPSTELLGIRYDSVTKKYIQPKSDTTDGFIDTAKINSQLFQIPDDYDNIKCNVETINASRYMLGIRDVNIANYTFEETSEYITTAFHFDKPINYIALESSELIPDSYGEGNWLTYSISLDEGQHWYELKPKHRSYEGKSTYLVNSKIPIEQQQVNIGYIELTNDVNDIRLKINLSRPRDADSVYSTPIVLGYNLKVKSGGES